jgi:hypothetical protein
VPRETLEDTARRVGHARWLEQRCFEILGGWVASTPESDAKLVFARQSHHHAWHAELFDKVLPSANGFDANGLVTAPSADWDAFLADLAAAPSTGDRLAGVYELLMPATIAEYERWSESADPVRDAPLRRWLGFVIADERADLSEGRALLDARPGPGPTSRRADLEAAHNRAGALLR